LSTPFRLRLPRRLYEDMVRHAVQEFPNECCGLLAGRIVTDAQGASVATVEARFPLVNELASPVEYTSDGRSMLKAELARRERGLEFLAVYHSHPSSEPIPSKNDLERNYYGTTMMHLIVSLKAQEPSVQAWWLIKERYEQAQWELVGE
jgi:[CysO sulfur-carrier protein]-S-L-cysteine hydrolase